MTTSTTTTTPTTRTGRTRSADELRALAAEGADLGEVGVPDVERVQGRVAGGLGILVGRQGRRTAPSGTLAQDWGR